MSVIPETKTTIPDAGHSALPLRVQLHAYAVVIREPNTDTVLLEASNARLEIAIALAVAAYAKIAIQREANAWHQDARAHEAEKALAAQELQLEADGQRKAIAELIAENDHLQEELASLSRYKLALEGIAEMIVKASRVSATKPAENEKR